MEQISNLLAEYCFDVTLYFRVSSDEGSVSEGLSVGASAIRVSAQGFELWRAAIGGRNIFHELLGAVRAKVVFSDHKGKARRTVEMDISMPKSLPIGTVSGDLMVATERGFVGEGILFQEVRGIIVRDITENNSKEEAA